MCEDVKRECLAAQALSDELITEGLAEATGRRVRDHIASCEVCRKRHERRARLWDVLGRELVGVRNGVLAETRRRVEAVHPLAPERPRWVPVISWDLSRRVALAASFAVALALGVYIGPLLRSRFAETPAATTGQTALDPRLQTFPTDTPMEEVVDRLRQDGDVYWERGRRPLFVRRRGKSFEVLPLVTLDELERHDASPQAHTVPAALEAPQY